MLQVRGLRKSFLFRDTLNHALAGIDLDIAQGEFFVLLGPSGCGKTTMLRSIAGLEHPEAGEIRIDGTVVLSGDRNIHVPPDRRPIGMVFQSYAVWPHMDVFENVAFPLREGVQRLNREAVRTRVDEVLTLLGLDTMADRPVTTLSGGQQQRVAQARALALQPKVLLMDEPLSNLDYRLQVRLRAELRELMHRLGLTTVHVTHNQAEALETGDRIAVMDRGRIVQLGPPREIYQRPRDEFVARFIGDMNLVAARLRAIEAGHAILDTPFGAIRAQPPGNGDLRPGEACFLGIRPEDARFAATGAEETDNAAKGSITGAQFIGEANLFTVRIGETVLQIKTHHSHVADDGAAVTVHLPARHCTVVLRGDARNAGGAAPEPAPA